MKVIISEKEEAGRRIAEAILPSFSEEQMLGINVFRTEDTIIVPARGHIVNYKIKGLRSAKSLRQLPIAEIKWGVAKNNKSHFKLITSLLKNANEYVVATDWDREGEVIGYNLIRYILGEEDPNNIQRAYYSSLRSEDLRNSFSSIRRMNQSLLTQGLARNLADLIVGLNLTKAITLLFKTKYEELSQSISLGRVQSPLLGQIKNSVGVRLSDEQLTTNNNTDVETYYVDLGEVQYSLKLNESPNPNKVLVTEINEEEEGSEDQAEDLFDTTDIMTIAKILPEEIMNIMEQLYLKGYLTYPRTTSKYVKNTKLLEEIEEAVREEKDIPEDFSWENVPEHEVEEAHPDAILLTPEGIKAYFDGTIKGREKFIADIILNRIIRSFAPPLVTKLTIVTLEYTNEDGHTITQNFEWNKIYNNKEEAISLIEENIRELPEEGKSYPIIKIRERFEGQSNWGMYRSNIRTLSDTDLLVWMNNMSIGTEATRQMFPGVLRERNYIDESNLPTTLGEIVGGMINKDIGITTSLTVEMERNINSLRNMSELPTFLGNIVETTSQFIKKIASNCEVPEFYCPKGHKATLVNRMNKFTGKGVLLMKCYECDKYYGL